MEFACTFMQWQCKPKMVTAFSTHTQHYLLTAHIERRDPQCPSRHVPKRAAARAHTPHWAPDIERAARKLWPGLVVSAGLGGQQKHRPLLPDHSQDIAFGALSAKWVDIGHWVSGVNSSVRAKWRNQAAS